MKLVSVVFIAIYSNLYLWCVLPKSYGIGQRSELRNSQKTVLYIVWWRFIDDIFCIWCGGQDSLDEFINYINSFHATIKFIASYSPNSVNFLDVTINKSPRASRLMSIVNPLTLINTSFLTAATPNTAKEAIAYSQALRIRRICSTDLIQETVVWTEATPCIPGS